MLSINSFLHKKLVLLSNDTPAQFVARAMRDNEIGCVLITDKQGHLAGIVTDRDFACRWAVDYSNPSIPISQIMTTEVLKAEESSSVSHIISLMETHGVRRIPIVTRDMHGEKERVIGIVTLDDLIVSGAVTPSHLGQIVRRQIGRRLNQATRLPRTARSERRSDAHMHQTLDRFYTYLAQATGLSPDIIPQITHFLLGCLIMRITAPAASHFIAQLPKLIQPSLLRIPPGPDRTTTVGWILSELGSRYGFTDEFARSLLSHFLGGLQNFMGPGAIRNLKSQLPDRFRTFFPSEVEKITVLRDLSREMSVYALSLTSPAFQENGEIPRKFTGEGEDQSPPLRWSNVPSGTKEFVILCEDTDSVFETSWVHWMIYGISPSITSISEGIPEIPEIDLPVRARQGKNSWGNIGYQGPMPPVAHAPHRYFFRVYALDREIPLAAGVTRVQLANEMRGHILGEGILTGLYRHSALKKAA